MPQAVLLFSTTDTIPGTGPPTPRLDTTLLFPNHEGAHIDLDTWRLNHWTPAIRAAGLNPKLTPYSMRHYFISEAIKNPALSMYEITQVAGTSAAMIEATYGHKMGDLGNRWRAALDASDQTFGHLSDTGRRNPPCVEK